MKLYGGLDLHSTNVVIQLINEKDEVMYRKKLGCDLDRILAGLEPFKETIEGLAVESTFNWYWLVDGLMDVGYPVQLVNTAAVKQYEGLKYTDDDSDAFWLAHLMRLGILPTGYIYPKATRGVRDLLWALEHRNSLCRYWRDSQVENSRQRTRISLFSSYFDLLFLGLSINMPIDIDVSILNRFFAETKS